MISIDHRFTSALLGLGLIALLLTACGSEEPGPKTTGLSMSESAEAAATVPAASTAARSDRSNIAPIIEEVAIRPSTPRPGERVTAVVTASDPDGDPVKLTYRWYNDGQPLPQTGPELMLEGVSKGSEIGVTVTAHDGFEPGLDAEATVYVVNQSPILRGVVFEPLGEVSRAHDVTASPRSFDPDGDEVEYRYAWRVNGEELFNDSDSLSTRDFKRGDEIVLSVTADDGQDQSKPLVSDPITVVNAPPTITSDPSGFDGERFVYRVDARDPDGDRTLRYHLVQGPDGMQIDVQSGLVTWNPRSDQAGEHRVEIRVEDQKGGSDRQGFELSLGFEPAEESPASPSP